MATAVRQFETGGYYHVYNRGNRKAAIFLCVEDYARFLAKLGEYSHRYGVGAAAWCLMPNHYHLVLRQDKEDGIMRMMRSLGTSMAKYFNWQYGSVGHLCQERYQARTVKSEADLLNLTAYVHANPQAIDNYATYRWSSYSSYVAKRGALPEAQRVFEITGLPADQYEVYMANYIISKRSSQPISGVTG